MGDNRIHPYVCVAKVRLKLTHAREFIGCKDKSIPTGAVEASHCVGADIKAASVIYVTLVLVYGESLRRVEAEWDNNNQYF